MKEEKRTGLWKTRGLGLLILLIGVMLPGCGRKGEGPGEGGDPMAMVGEGGQGAGEASVELEKVNAILREYVRVRKSIPRDISELVSSGFVPGLPAPPSGQRYRILLHPMGYTVVLEKQ